MKENPSPGSRKQHVLSPKKLVAAFLVMTIVALSFAWLFTSGGQTSAASATSPTTYTHLAVDLISPEDPSVVSPGSSIGLKALVTTYGPNETIAKVEFYYSPGGVNPPPLILIGSTSQKNPISGGYTMTWTAPSVANDYFVTAKAYDTVGNVATSMGLGVWVENGTPTAQLPPFVNIVITSPSNGVYTLPAQIPFTVTLYDELEGGDIGFTAILEPNGPTTYLTPSPTNFTEATWIPTQPGIYDLRAQFSSLDEQGWSDTIAVQINPPQTTPTVQISPTTPRSGACKVSYQLASQWAGGLNVNVVVTNHGAVSINGWTLAFTFLGDQKITQLWNGSYTQTGEQVSITNASYNATINPGGTVNFGFNGSWTSSDTGPTIFTLNGVTCSAS